jgi:hypothetical protein
MFSLYARARGAAGARCEAASQDCLLANQTAHEIIVERNRKRGHSPSKCVFTQAPFGTDFVTSLERKEATIEGGLVAKNASD